MSRAPTFCRRRLTLTSSLAVWAALLLLAWLDRDGCLVVNQAGLFAFIVTALQAVAQALGVAAAAVATSVAAAVVWLANMFGWLALRVVNIMKSTGAIFSKVWEWGRRLWFDVLRPALGAVYDFTLRVYRWLDRVLAPVFKVLNRIRDTLLKIYAQYVRPILEGIEIARAVLRILSRLGLDWAAALDRKLELVQSTITRNFLRVLREVNKAIDVLNRVVTFDGLIQRFALIRSIERDLRFVSRSILNWRARTLTPEDYDRVRSTANARTLEDARTDAAEGLLTHGGRWGPLITEAQAQWRIYLRQ